MKFEIGDPVERLIDDGVCKRWEDGYTVIEPPENPFGDCIYIAKPYSRGFENYYVGVPLQHLRHALKPETD